MHPHSGGRQETESPADHTRRLLLIDDSASVREVLRVALTPRRASLLPVPFGV